MGDEGGRPRAGEGSGQKTPRWAESESISAGSEGERKMLALAWAEPGVAGTPATAVEVHRVMEVVYLGTVSQYRSRKDVEHTGGILKEIIECLSGVSNTIP